MRAAVVLGIALAFGSGSLVFARPDTPVRRGHAIAVRACAACHAVEPGEASARLSAPGFATSEMQHVAGLEGRVAELTRTGHYEMPPIPLSASEVADLVAYIQSLDVPPKPRPYGR